MEPFLLLVLFFFFFSSLKRLWTIDRVCRAIAGGARVPQLSSCFQQAMIVALLVTCMMRMLLMMRQQQNLERKIEKEEIKHGKEARINP